VIISNSTQAKWKWCAVASLAMVLLSLIPQLHLWVVRGRDWNGAYVSPQGDEPLYSAYINALIDGRTRKNDPFGGKDSSPSAPLPESIFSIQFVPAYLIALPARIFGASASTAFIVLIAAAALLASLSVFWLINCVAGDPRLAAAGALFVLCFGALAGGNGLFGILLKPDLSIPSLPFLRRYQPAAAFPLFFVFNVLVWRALSSQTKRSARVHAVLAGLTLATLVFSYLYLWTATAAWLACIGVLWLYFRSSDRWQTAAVLTTIGAITAIALVPYVYLLSRRVATLDEQQILISSHRPDLLRVPEILGAAILVALVIGIVRRRIERTDQRLIYTASLVLLPFVVFNQQVLTGKTMQAYHFEAFIVNYSTLVALVITVTLLWLAVPDRLLIYVAALSFSWGIVEVGLPSRLNYVPAAIVKDQGIPALLRLKELSNEDGTLADLRTKGQASTLVFSPDVSLIALLPTWTSQGTLLDISGVDCGNVTREERKEFFYMHLYYSKSEIQRVRKALNERDQFAIAVIFDHRRLFPALSSQFQPIQTDEIEREALAYQTHANSFSREEALKRPITYAVIPFEGNFDFTNLDRWYERDAGERVGAYTLYRLKLRD
jgi:hypothetical protein